MYPKQSPSLTEQEIKSVYRNEFYETDGTEYFRNPVIKAPKPVGSLKITVKKKGNVNIMDKFYGKIRLVSIDDVKCFAEAANKLPCDVEVSSGRYIVNGKSILSLFGLDLSKDVMLRVDKEYIDSFEEWVDE